MPDCSLKEAWNEGKAKFDAVVLPGNFVWFIHFIALKNIQSI
jgi:hypothetical protein